MIVQIEPFESATPVKCHHPRCDGRGAKWTFPQTRHLPSGPMLSCSVHLARFCEIVLNYHAVPIPINIGRRPRHRAHDARTTSGSKRAA